MTPLAMSLLGGLVRHKGVSQRTGLFLLPCTGKTLLLSIEIFKNQQLVTTQQRRCEYLLHMYTRESLGLGLLSVFVKSPHL